MKQIHEIFPTPIYETKLDLDLEYIQEYCREIHLKKKYKNRKVSNLGGFQTELSLEDANIKQLIVQIENHANMFSTNIINNMKQKITNIWLNVNGYKNSNLSHSHPNSDLSGCYYVRSPENCGNIVFEHPCLDVIAQYQAKQEIDKQSTWTEYNAQNWQFAPKENSMYLFPSWVKHYVQANENDTGENRISIAFNLNHERD